MTLRADDPRPASQQVAEAIRADIASGVLAAGAKVPSVRELAKRFKVAPMTAQSALAALHAEGLVYASPGRGTFVRIDRPEGAGDHASSEFQAISARLDALSATVRHLERRLSALEEANHG